MRKKQTSSIYLHENDMSFVKTFCKDRKITQSSFYEELIREFKEKIKNKEIAPLQTCFCTAENKQTRVIYTPEPPKIGIFKRIYRKIFC